MHTAFFLPGYAIFLSIAVPLKRKNFLLFLGIALAISRIGSILRKQQDFVFFCGIETIYSGVAVVAK